MVDWKKLSTPRVTTKTFTLVDTVSPDHEMFRDIEGGTLYSSGRFVMNTNGSDLWEAVVRATPNMALGTCIARGGADEEKMLIAVYAVPPGTLGGRAVRLKERPNATDQFNVTLYLRDVFKKHPTLRFTGKRKVAVAADWDSAGRPFLEIQLQTQLTAKTTKRKGSTEKKKDPGTEKEKAIKPTPAPDLAAEADLETEDEE